MVKPLISPLESDSQRPSKRLRSSWTTCMHAGSASQLLISPALFWSNCRVLPSRDGAFVLMIFKDTLLLIKKKAPFERRVPPEVFEFSDHFAACCWLMITMLSLTHISLIDGNGFLSLTKKKHYFKLNFQAVARLIGQMLRRDAATRRQRKPLFRKSVWVLIGKRERFLLALWRDWPFGGKQWFHQTENKTLYWLRVKPGDDRDADRGRRDEVHGSYRYVSIWSFNLTSFWVRNETNHEYAIMCYYYYFDFILLWDVVLFKNRKRLLQRQHRSSSLFFSPMKWLRKRKKKKLHSIYLISQEHISALQADQFSARPHQV